MGYHSRGPLVGTGNPVFPENITIPINIAGITTVHYYDRIFTFIIIAIGRVGDKTNIDIGYIGSRMPEKGDQVQPVIHLIGHIDKLHHSRSGFRHRSHLPTQVNILGYSFIRIDKRFELHQLGSRAPATQVQQVFTPQGIIGRAFYLPYLIQVVDYLLRLGNTQAAYGHIAGNVIATQAGCKRLVGTRRTGRRHQLGIGK